MCDPQILSGASTVLVHGGGGSKSQPDLPCHLRRVVPEGSFAGVVHQVGGGYPPGPPSAPGFPAQPLDLRHDERCVH